MTASEPARGDHTMRRIALAGLAVAIGVGVGMNWPDVVRYWKMRRM